MFDNTMELPQFDTSSISGMPTKDKDFSGTRFQEAPQQTHFIDCDFSGTRWEGAALAGHLFTRCRFDSAQFNNCSFARVRFINCSGERVMFRQSFVLESHWEDGRWSDVGWTECRLLRPLFNQLKGGNWAVHGCELAFVTLAQLEFSALSVSGSVVRDCSLVESKVGEQLWQEVHMDRVTYANCHFAAGRWLACRGVNNRWLGLTARNLVYQSCVFDQSGWSRSEIDGASFTGNALRIAGFDNGKYCNFTFHNNQLYMILFDKSCLTACRFQERQVAYLSFREARLEACDLRGMTGEDLDVRGCELHDTAVDGLNFIEANVTGQNPQDWRGAELNFARFEVPEAEQDADWWSACRPGAVRRMS